jgi:hypothetical protein
MSISCTVSNLPLRLTLLLVYCLGLAVLVSCNGAPEVLFEAPQPVGSSDILAYPASLRNTYSAIDTSGDTTWLEVTADQILVSNGPTEIEISELQEAKGPYKLYESYLFDSISKKQLPFKRVGDTLYFSRGPAQPRFKLGPASVLRQAGNTYVLNEYNSQKGYWAITIFKTAGNEVRVWYPKAAEFNGVPPQQRRPIILLDSTGKETQVDYYLLNLPATQFQLRCTAILQRPADQVYRRQ